MRRLATFRVIAVLGGALLTYSIAGAAHADVKRDSITQLMEMTGVRKLLDEMIPPQVSQIMNLIRVANSTIPDNFLVEMEALLIDEFKRAQPELIDQMISTYSRAFTHQEVKDMIAFYESPTGIKVIRVLPDVTRHMMAIGQVWGRDVGARAWNRMVEEAREKGYEL